MLKKDIYAILYAITLLIVAGSVFYYIFFAQKKVIEVFNNDPKLIQVATKQGSLGQQITKRPWEWATPKRKETSLFFKLN